MIGKLAWDYPFLSYGLGLCIMALPFVLVLGRDSHPSPPQPARWYLRSPLVLVGILVVATATFRYLSVAYPVIGGVDFYFYLCNARDYLYGLRDQSLDKYAYFPGGYRFWEFMMAIFGEKESTLQFVVLGILAANTFLAGAIVCRCVKSPAAGIIAGFWYLAFASRFEMLEGTTEPVATLFALAGLFAWGGMPLRGAPGWRRALLLGGCLGLAAWTKQQGGLVAVGAAVLAVNYLIDRPEERDSKWQILAIPAAAICVFLVALLLEGHGLEPLRIGLGTLDRYEARGSVVANLPSIFRQMGMALWFVLLASFFWIVMFGSYMFGGARQEPWQRVVAFALIAGLATTAQFSRRSYFHYALLAAPFLAIAVTSFAARIAQSAGAAWPRLRPLVGIVTAGALVMPAVGPGSAGFLQVWPLAWHPVVSHPNPWHRSPVIAADLLSLAKELAPGEDLLILPPRRNVIHYLIGTLSLSSPLGYGWGPFDATKVIKSGSPDAILVLDRRTFDHDDGETCKLLGCDKAVSSLSENGFRKTTTLKTMTLWRRDGRARPP